MLSVQRRNVLTHPRTIPILLALILVVFVIWMRDPNLDLRLTAAFYNDGHFQGDAPGLIQTLRTHFWNLSLVVAWLSLGAVLAAYILRWQILWVSRRDWNIILWGFLLGPGLVVNAIFKTFSGRARPRDVLQFGGDQFFTPIGQIANQCARDCSFVSGEVSGTTATCIALWMILSAHAHRLSPEVETLGRCGILAMFVFVFWQRVASGGHFVSDALLAALFTALIMVILARAWPQAADPLDKP
jgi:lipid A 4'-phosphatase